MKWHNCSKIPRDLGTIISNCEMSTLPLTHLKTKATAVRKTQCVLAGGESFRKWRAVYKCLHNLHFKVHCPVWSSYLYKKKVSCVALLLFVTKKRRKLLTVRTIVFICTKKECWVVLSFWVLKLTSNYSWSMNVD